MLLFVSTSNIHRFTISPFHMHGHHQDKPCIWYIHTVARAIKPYIWEYVYIFCNTRSKSEHGTHIIWNGLFTEIAYIYAFDSMFECVMCWGLIAHMDFVLSSLKYTNTFRWNSIFPLMCRGWTRSFVSVCVSVCVWHWKRFLFHCEVPLNC